MNLSRVAPIFLLTAALARAAGPDASAMADAVARLADADPDVRSAALVELMELSPADLPKLKAVATAGPLDPEQREALRTAVVHVLTRQAIAKVPTTNAAFMGVVLPILPPFAVQPGVVDDSPAAVVRALPGFAAARVLQGGDVIVGLRYAGESVAFTTSVEVIAYVSRMPPGTTIELIVHRGQRTLNLPIRLDARPLMPEPMLQGGGRTVPFIDNAVSEAERGYVALFEADAAAQ